jgi:hypothetical protein
MTSSPLPKSACSPIDASYLTAPRDAQADLGGSARLMQKNAGGAMKEPKHPVRSWAPIASQAVDCQPVSIGATSLGSVA